ncbi:MAG: IgGFc-binding protein [Labilithrix sp.]|nr:IgGFc-binding protein [Labilithrix sp.]
MRRVWSTAPRTLPMRVLFAVVGVGALVVPRQASAELVRTQDADHPIYLAAYMTGTAGGYHGSAQTLGWGDPEFVNVVPAGQYLNAHSFYADPTYDETSLVIVRAKSHGTFKDVWLECAGNLTDFQTVGTRGEYEFTRVDLSWGKGPGQTFGDKTCQSGLQRMKSDGPFTATLWGWAYSACYTLPRGNGASNARHDAARPAPVTLRTATVQSALGQPPFRAKAGRTVQHAFTDRSRLSRRASADAVTSSGASRSALAPRDALLAPC